MFDAQAIAQQAQENAPQMDRTPIQPGWYKVTITYTAILIEPKMPGSS